jgi:hypothetical protein
MQSIAARGLVPGVPRDSSIRATALDPPVSFVITPRLLRVSFGYISFLHLPFLLLINCFLTILTSIDNLIASAKLSMATKTASQKVQLHYPTTPALRMFTAPQQLLIMPN